MNDHEDAEFEAAKTLASGGDRAGAEQAYRRIVEKNPSHFKALNNLGTILEEREQYQGALILYQQALDAAPDSTIVLFNIGHVLYRQGRLDDAVQTWRDLLSKDPDNTEVLYNLGNALMDKRAFVQAAAVYLKCVELDPDFYHAYSNMGTAFFEMEQYPAAQAAFIKATEMTAHGADHFNLAKVREILGDHAGAEQAYRTSLDLLPDSGIAFERLTYLLERTGATGRAREVVSRWLEQMPDHPVAQHVNARYEAGAPPPRAPDRYVRHVFDNFAANFDKSLAMLDYQAPAHIAAELERLLTPRTDLSVLDAGCGTGLCAGALRRYAGTLAGVDLSPRMLDQARQRMLYDELVEAEITAFLERSPARFDLIVACDTLNYFGDLDRVLRAGFVALRPGGLLVFSVESSDHDEPYRLESHGRYTHDPGYVQAVLQAAGYRHESATSVRLRMEAGAPVPGDIVSAWREV